MNSAQIRQTPNASRKVMQNEERDIYDDGYRLNVCIVLSNHAGEVLMAQRFEGRTWWQFPQGGIKEGETPIEAMYRELHEEVGLKPSQVRLVAEAPRWLRYRLPPERIPQGMAAVGQKQRWFLLELRCPDHAIDLNQTEVDAEFARWTWVDFWEPLRRIVRFKRRVYREALEHLWPHVGNEVS